MPTWRNPWLAAVFALWLAACSSSPPAPVVDKSTRPAPQEIPVDGLYRVRRGDSLHAIAFKYGLDYRDIAAWNNVRSPYTIFPDQVLRLTAPPRTASTVTQQASKPVTRPTQPVKRQEPRTAPSDTTAGASNPSKWIWPIEGRPLSTFRDGDPARNGLDIAGREGQSIRASAAGQVVYSGNGLIGYGELVIIKHSEQMLSAYAHNRSRLVREGDQVRQGQQIAELGRNGRNEQVLHFEIRRNGKPVDPLIYLPKQ